MSTSKTSQDYVVSTLPTLTYKPFSDISLQRAIDRAVANLPADNTMALVAHVDNDEGASLSAVVKIGNEWKLRPRWSRTGRCRSSTARR